MFLKNRCLLVIFLFGFYAGNGVADEILIGLDADMSKVARDSGIAIAAGAQVAIEDINKQGGVLGRELKLMVRDHRGNPARGLDNVRFYVKQQGLVAVMSGAHTPVAMAELDYLHSKDTLFLIPWAAGTGLVDNGFTPNNVFRVSVRDEWVGDFLVEQAASAGARNIAVLLERTAWGRSNALSIDQASAQRGLRVVNKSWFNWGTSDFSVILENILSSRPDYILLVSNAPEGAALAKAMAQLPAEQRLPILSHWGIAAGAFVESVGLEALSKIDVRVLQSFSPAAANNPALARDVLKRVNEVLAVSGDTLSNGAAAGAAQAYDLVKLLALAIEAAGSTETARIRKAMEQLPDYDGIVRFYSPAFTRQDHEGLKPTDLFLAYFDDKGELQPLAEPMQVTRGHAHGQ